MTEMGDLENLVIHLDFSFARDITLLKDHVCKWYVNARRLEAEGLDKDPTDGCFCAAASSKRPFRNAWGSLHQRAKYLRRIPSAPGVSVSKVNLSKTVNTSLCQDN